MPGLSISPGGPGLAVLDDQAHHQQQLLLAEDNVAAAQLRGSRSRARGTATAGTRGQHGPEQPATPQDRGDAGTHHQHESGKPRNAVSMTSPDANSRTFP